MCVYIHELYTSWVEHVGKCWAEVARMHGLCIYTPCLAPLCMLCPYRVFLSVFWWYYIRIHPQDISVVSVSVQWGSWVQLQHGDIVFTNTNTIWVCVLWSRCIFHASVSHRRIQWVSEWRSYVRQWMYYSVLDVVLWYCNVTLHLVM